MSIQHRPDRPKPWRARYYGADGRERSRSFRRKIDAERFLATQTADKVRGEWTAPEHARETVAACAARWRRSIVHLKPSSEARVRATLEHHVLPRWGDVALSDVVNSDVRAWVADLLASGMSASSARKAVHVLRRVLASAVADRRIPYNPADDVPLPSDATGEQRFLTADEVYDLADAMAGIRGGEGARYRALVLVAAYGGLRFGELGALRRRRVDVLRGRVEVAETLSDVGGDLSFVTPKSKRSRRTVPLPRRIMGELEAHMDRYVDAGADALLFTTTDGTPLRRTGFRRSWWLPAVESAGLAPLKFHEMRHTYVSLLIDAGANWKEVSTWAGHSSAAFTLDTYGHLYQDRTDDVSARLDALLDAAQRRPRGDVRDIAQGE